MVTTATVNPSYSPGGAYVHPYSMHCSLRPDEPATNCISIGSVFSRFVHLTQRRGAWIEPSYSPVGANLHSHLIAYTGS